MRRLILRALGVVLFAGTGAVGLCLAGNPNERDVKPEANVQDTDDIDHERKPDSKLWVLHFRFKDPRLITADIPGRGRRLCWYMWYQVINYTNEPQIFIPDFELVTQEKSAVYHDQVLPSVQEAIRMVEDGQDQLKIKNSVTIAENPIPTSKKDGPERAVTGVAIWDGGRYLLTEKSLAALRDALEVDGEKGKAAMDKIATLKDKAFETQEGLLEELGRTLARSELEKYQKLILKHVWEDKDLSESNRYSIFISGLSNGVTETDDKVIRRKTLRLDFKKVGDQYYQDAREIHFMPPATWTYRAANLKTVLDVKPAPKDGLANPPMK